MYEVEARIFPGIGLNQIRNLSLTTFCKTLRTKLQLHHVANRIKQTKKSVFEK